MTVEAIQNELSELSQIERGQILEFLQNLESDCSEETRLEESVNDFKKGRTVGASDLHAELKDRLASR